MIRLLIDNPAEGPINMARDEAMMTVVGEHSAPPTLRLYQWASPTISLGYFQRFADYEALPAPAGGLAVVRRLTGGGAILHDLELTYSLSFPLGHSLLKQGPNRLYELAHDAAIAAFGDFRVSVNRCGSSDDSGAARGPFFCFERRHCYDVLWNGEKVAGSAQRRTRTAVLQHGSIFVANRFTQQSAASVISPDEHDNIEARIEELKNSLPGHFQSVLGVPIGRGLWQDSELKLAGELVEKYKSREWTRRA